MFVYSITSSVLQELFSSKYLFKKRINPTNAYLLMDTFANSYKGIVTSFCSQTIPNWYYLFRITKCCGFSCLVIVPKYSTLADLKKTINLQIGTHYNTTYYISKNDNNPVYLSTLENTLVLGEYLQNIPMAYSIDECPLSVYQLYYDSECGCDRFI